MPRQPGLSPPRQGGVSAPFQGDKSSSLARLTYILLEGVGREERHNGGGTSDKKPPGALDRAQSAPPAASGEEATQCAATLLTRPRPFALHFRFRPPTLSGRTPLTLSRDALCPHRRLSQQQNKMLTLKSPN